MANEDEFTRKDQFSFLKGTIIFLVAFYYAFITFTYVIQFILCGCFEFMNDKPLNIIIPGIIVFGYFELSYSLTSLKAGRE